MGIHIIISCKYLIILKNLVKFSCFSTAQLHFVDCKSPMYVKNANRFTNPIIANIYKNTLFLGWNIFIFNSKNNILFNIDNTAVYFIK